MRRVKLQYRAPALFSLAVLFVLVMVGPLRAQLPPGEKLVPATTKLFVTCRSVKELVDARSQTLFGKLDDEPLMKAFFDDLKVQLEKRSEEGELKLGLKIADIQGICDGQLTLAIAAFPPTADGKPRTGTMLLVDVTGHAPQAEQARTKLAASLAQRKAQQTPFKTPSGAAGFEYVVPPEKEGGRTVDFCEVIQNVGNSTVWLIGMPTLVTDVSAALAGAAPGPTLDSVEAFQNIMQQSAPAKGEPAAQVALFVDPLGLDAALRAYEPPNTRHKPDGLVVLTEAGFDAVKGIGGQLAFHVGDYGLLLRAAVLAPQPWKKSMNMLTFAAGADFAPQTWVNDGVAGYTTLYWDMLKAFDNFGPLFDGFLEQEGIWNDVVESMKKDPDGPQIDIRAEFFALLGKRVTAIVDPKLPATPDSARYLLAFEIGNPADLKRVLEAMKKAFANDPSVEQMKLGELDVYKIIATEEVPPNAPNQEGVKDGVRVIASSFLTASGNHVFFASHLDILQKVLGPPPPQGLATAPDYVTVSAELGKFLPQQNPNLGLLSFQRLDKLLEIDYELFRTGQLAGANTGFGKLLDQIMADPERVGPRPNTINGGKLPPFEQVRKYFPPVGVVARITADGWHFTALSHEKSAPGGQPAAATNAGPSGK